MCLLTYWRGKDRIIARGERGTGGMQGDRMGAGKKTSFTIKVLSNQKPNRVMDCSLNWGGGSAEAGAV